MKLGTAKLIDDAILASRKKKEKRNHVGASILGTECDRKLWYMINQPNEIDDPRTIRIFELGDAIENELVRFFRQAGLTVYDKDENGNQFGFDDGDIKGKTDGVVMGLPESSQPHLLEFKSASNKNFKAFEKDGVNGNEVYKAQCHIYMLKMKLNRCLFVVYNKDTSAIYYERFKVDKTYAEIMLARGREILNAKEMPSRKYKKSTFFKCKMCDWSKECWQ